MAIVEWSESFSVKNTTIDEQHKKLIDLVNKLHEAMAAGHGRDILSSVLDDMIDYTDYHFQTEEKAFEKFGYDKAEIHKAQHREFVTKIKDLKSKYKEGGFLLTIETLQYLVNWISNHISKSDHQYIPLLAGKEL
jgi:hemerythrin-like metal-binding protein